VALKLLTAYRPGEPSELERFRREARAAASLSHPNVAAVYEVGEFEGHHFIAMELVEGESLAERLRGAPLSSEVALDIATQVADGLAAAHSKGIVHRDIKPENIMLRTGGQEVPRAEITDFGLARLVGSARITQS